MNWIKNLSLTVKLMIGFAIVGLLSRGRLLYPSWITEVNTRIADLRTRSLERTRALAGLRTSTLANRIHANQVLAAKDPNSVQQGIAQLRQELRDRDERAEEIEGRFETGDARKAIHKHRELWKQLEGDLEVKVFKPILDGDAEGARRNLPETAPQFKPPSKRSKDCADLEQASVDRKLDEVVAFEGGTQTWVLGGSLAALVLALAIGFVLARGITSTLGRIFTVLGSVAKGDFSQRVGAKTQDEIGRLSMVLDNILGTIQTTSAESRGLAAMVEQSPTNIMFADREFKIRYVNPSTVKTLRKLEHLLPIKADQLVGQSIDIFHKRPEHQRRMLSEPNNLPHRTQFVLGGETLELQVSALFDRDRTYLGAMVTWDIVTQRVATEQKVKEGAERDKKNAEELTIKVEQILKTVNALAEGNFTQNVADLGEDAIGQVASALNKAIDSVRTA